MRLQSNWIWVIIKKCKEPCDLSTDAFHLCNSIVVYVSEAKLSSLKLVMYRGLPCFMCHVRYDRSLIKLDMQFNLTLTGRKHQWVEDQSYIKLTRRMDRKNYIKFNRWYISLMGRLTIVSKPISFHYLCGVELEWASVSIPLQEHGEHVSMVPWSPQPWYFPPHNCSDISISTISLDSTATVES